MTCAAIVVATSARAETLSAGPPTTIAAGFLGVAAESIRVERAARPGQILPEYNVTYTDPVRGGQRSVQIDVDIERGVVLRARWPDTGPSPDPSGVSLPGDALRKAAEAFQAAHPAGPGLATRLASVQPASGRAYQAYIWENSREEDGRPHSKQRLVLRPADGQAHLYTLMLIHTEYLDRAKVTREQAVEAARVAVLARYGGATDVTVQTAELCDRSPFTEPGYPVWNVALTVGARLDGAEVFAAELVVVDGVDARVTSEPQR